MSPTCSLHGHDLSRRIVRRKRRSRETRVDAPIAATPKCRILLPLSEDVPELTAFAIDECQHRDAELLVLFLRPLAMTPMGPNPLPGLDEDHAARALFERVRREAESADVPVRTFYEKTFDRTATILDVTRRHEADVLLVGTSRRGWFRKALAGDIAQSILAHLPERASVMVHAV